MPRDFANEPFISLGREHRVRDVVDELFEAHGISRRTDIDTNLFESACELVMLGTGMSIVDLVSASTVRDRVVVRPLSPGIGFPIEIVRPIAGLPSALIDGFVHLFRQKLGDVLRDFAGDTR